MRAMVEGPPVAHAVAAAVAGLMTRAKPTKRASRARITRIVGGRIVGVTLIDRHGIWAWPNGRPPISPSAVNFAIVRRMDKQAFFTRDGDGYLPTPASRGPWDPKSLHGRVIVGLLGTLIEARHGGPEFTPARLTVDMYALPGLDRVEVTTRLIKDGWRIKVAEAEFFSGGVAMARASCQLLRRTAAPEGQVWKPPAWSVPSPDDIAPPTGSHGDLGGMWAVRPIVGEMGAIGPRRLWMAEVRALVEGEPLTPFARAALAADFASPFANAGAAGLAYINSDVTLYLCRPPAGAWIGVEVVNHQSAEGVAIGECWLHDERGAIGSATVAALARGNKRLAG